jgi:hypothetical protein
MFSVKIETVVFAAMIDTTPNVIRSENRAISSGMPAATRPPNASSRITRLNGNAIVSARVRSFVVVSENSR